MIVTLVSEYIDTADEIFRDTFQGCILRFKEGDRNFKRVYTFKDDIRFHDVNNWIENAISCNLIRNDSNIQH